MIYERRPCDAALGQGDIFDECPLIYWTTERDEVGEVKSQGSSSTERVIVLTQACDLANAKTSKVQVAVVHATPFREHLAQHFATAYSRIALLEPYETEPSRAIC